MKTNILLTLCVCLICATCWSQRKPATISALKAYIDLGKPPFSMKPGMDAAAACEIAIDSLSRTYGGGRVFLPYAYSWGRPRGKQKGVLLRSNIVIEGVGQRLTLIDNCPWFSSDFGKDSIGFEINGNLDSNMTNIPVASSAGAKIGDTVFGRFGTAPYDAGEPAVFGWYTIKKIPDAKHITLNKACGSNMRLQETISLNRRLIRVRKITSNVTISNLEFYSNRPLAEAGVYIQGGFDITVDNVHATNPGSGIVNFQFCDRCVLQNSVVDSAAKQGKADWGRGVTLSECVDCVITKNRFNKYQTVAIDNEANNPGVRITNNVFNNNYDKNPRIAIISLGSGDIMADSNRFTGYQHRVYDQAKSFGKLRLKNTTVDKGTDFEYCEQTGIVTNGFLHMGDTKFSQRKTFTKTFIINGVQGYAFDSLPRGLIVGATVKVDDATGITAFFFRRDNSFTNNSMDFSNQLRSGQTSTLNLGETFKIGTTLGRNFLNYNTDKSFVVITNNKAKPNNSCTVTITYLENPSGPLIASNKMAKNTED